MTSRLGAWAVPRHVLLVSALAAVVLLAPLIGGYLLAGPTAAIGIGMGYLVSTRTALGLRPAQALGLVVPGAMAGAVAVAVRDQPLAAACFVALCCLLVAPANVLADGLMSGVPTIAAVLVAVPGNFEPAATAGWMLFGGLIMVVLGTRLGTPSLPAGLPQQRAWRHAIVMAVSVGVVVYLVALWDLPHGYWIALTLTVVLRAFDDETKRRSWERVLGTIGGVVLAYVLASSLPVEAVAVVLALTLVLALAYATTGDYMRQIAFLTPSVVLLGSAGSTGLVAVERAVATVLGALLAAAVALGLAWWEARRQMVGEDG